MVLLSFREITLLQYNLQKMVTRVWWTLPRDLVLWGFDHGRIQLVMFNFQTLTDASPPLPNRSANGLRNPVTACLGYVTGLVGAKC